MLNNNNKYSVKQLETGLLSGFVGVIWTCKIYITTLLNELVQQLGHETRLFQGKRKVALKFAESLFFILGEVRL